MPKRRRKPEKIKERVNRGLRRRIDPVQLEIWEQECRYAGGSATGANAIPLGGKSSEHGSTHGNNETAAGSTPAADGTDERATSGAAQAYAATDGCSSPNSPDWGSGCATESD